MRTNALSVLSHLILNDMIRVKGQIALLVLLLDDPSEHIQTLAKVFFTEWGKRGSATIYNIFPECVSSLLDMPNLEFGRFCSLTKYLLHFIDKVRFGREFHPQDKQCDQLVEKLLQRFVLVTDPLKWRCLAFCLLCIPSTNQTVQKYLQCRNCLKDALRTKETNEIINQIIGKVGAVVKYKA